MTAYHHGLGRRKASVARVYLAETKKAPKVIINDKDMSDFFPNNRDQLSLQEPLNLLGVSNQFDVKVTVRGGGTTGQSQAIRLGITRALLAYDEEKMGEEGAWRGLLKKAGLTTRDSRRVEPKKCGRPKARKKRQFSKR
ncbi:30S ribosomal protein S9 [Gammaproteobacteria bacterium]|jgi:small subunit ribosomal protein S9|nr:30S ribosomal protein S9 [Gammaproteobacteria bacterium]